MDLAHYMGWEHFSLRRGVGDSEVFEERKRKAIERPIGHTERSRHRYSSFPSNPIFALSDFVRRHPKYRSAYVNILVELLAGTVPRTAGKDTFGLVHIVQINRKIQIGIEPEELIPLIQKKIESTKEVTLKARLSMALGELYRCLSLEQYLRAWRQSNGKAAKSVDVLSASLNDEGKVVVVEINNYEAQGLRGASVRKVAEIMLRALTEDGESAERKNGGVAEEHPDKHPVPLAPKKQRR